MTITLPANICLEATGEVVVADVVVDGDVVVVVEVEVEAVVVVVVSLFVVTVVATGDA